MKQLLLEYIPFIVDPGVLKESLNNVGGPLIVQGILQRANAKNQNGRVYPRSVLERECSRFKANEIANRTAGSLGELDHPDSQIVNLKNASHRIVDLWWNGDDVMGKVEILTTPSGKILRSLFEHKVVLGISSRGMGSTKNLHEDNTVEVQDDFDLVTFDFVSNPSTQGAYLTPMHESVSRLSERDSYISKTHQLVTEIICDLSSKVVL